ncbi:putative vacuolar transporter chaperone, partial [Spraguea lophii 42_110]
HNNKEYNNREYSNRESEIYKRIHKLIKDNELYSFTKIKYKRIKIEKDTENNNIFYYDIKIEREHRYKRLKEIIIKTKENMNYERINILAYFIAKSKDYKFNNKKHILIHESSRGDDSINNRNTGNNRVIRYKPSRNTSSKESNSNSNNDRIITIPIRVEPKVFFANERTFLSWLQFAIFNGTIGVCIFCLSDGTKGNTGEVCGFILIMVSIIFAIYALYLYFYRVGLIRRRRVNYDNLYGPVVLTVVFISAMIFCVLYKLDEN